MVHSSLVLSHVCVQHSHDTGQRPLQSPRPQPLASLVYSAIPKTHRWNVQRIGIICSFGMQLCSLSKMHGRSVEVLWSVPFHR